MDPDYQRSGGVWTKQKKQLLIDSIINDYDVPKLYFHKFSKESSIQFDYSVIDGRQRLEAIWGFIDGHFNLADDIDYQQNESLTLGGLSYNDLAQSYPKVRIKFDSFVLPIVVVEVDDIDLIEDMFSRLNEAVPLNAAEKRNAIGGDMVKKIRLISNHVFFRRDVAFGDRRAQHKEVAARMLLTESSLISNGKLVDTKREFLDQLAVQNKSGNSQFVDRIGDNVSSVLKVMAARFSTKDPLLRAQGNMVIYYLLFRSAREAGLLDNITREKLISFREKLASNRKLAAEDFTKSDFELLEFDRLSQQGTNDASNIRTRFRTLASYLDIPALVEPSRTSDA